MPMDTINFRDLAVEEFDTRTLLAHATAQAIHRRYEDFFIADIDGHHFETLSFAQIVEFIEDPVLRQQAKYQGYGIPGITSPQGSYQEMGGRVTRENGRRKEPIPPNIHRDVTLTKRWMDAIGIDVVCLFPTPMLGLPLTPRPEVEVAMARAYNRWLVEVVLAQDPRIKASLYLPFNDPDASYRMVRDFGDKPGVVGFTIIAGRYRAVYDNAYMKTYAALEERGLPLVFHAGLSWGADQSIALCNRFMAVHALSFTWFNILHMTNWLCNGMPERFPKLKTVWVESGLAWIPFLMQRLDNEWMMRKLGSAVAQAQAVGLHARDVLLDPADGDGEQSRGAGADLQDDQRGNPALLFLGLSALGHGLAEHDLRSALPLRDRQAQHPRRQRQAVVQARPGHIRGQAAPARRKRAGVISGPEAIPDRRIAPVARISR